MTSKPKRLASRVAIASAVVICSLALILGLVFGLRAQHDSTSAPSSSNSSSNSTSNSTTTPTSTTPWRNSSEFLLSKNFVVTSTPTTRYYEWTLSQITAAPDGLTRQILVVNGLFPGPLVEANTGDRIIVKVTNNMVNGSSIHWHGMFQNGTNWMDGTTGVTQCPIPPGQSFTYNFTVPNQWGTYWWHAHTSSQYVDGLVGPLIIHSPSEPMTGDYDNDVIMMVSDWYHVDSGSLLSWYLSTASLGVEPVPDNGLINGMNNFNCLTDSTALFPSGAKCSSNASMATFNFKAGSRYRIRIINTSAFADFQISIDNHVMTVIEADGVNMQPVQVNRIPIHVAQRYSVIVNATQTVGNYWIRAVMNTNCFNVNNPALNPNVLGVVQYEGAPTANPNSTDWATAYESDCIDLTLSMLQPYIPQSAPDADVQYSLDLSFQTISASHINLGYVNSTTWTPLMNAPTLFSANQGVSTFDASQFIITLNSTQVVEIVLNNLDEGAHPFHFHGHIFWVLGWGNGSYIPGKTPLNTTNPLRRDTSTIPPFGYTVVRFVNDNPGLWALHCHIEWHMEAGLLVQFNSLPDQIKAFNIPPEMAAMCNATAKR